MQVVLLYCNCGYIAQITLNRINRNTICARPVEASSGIYCDVQHVLCIWANFLVVLAAAVVLLCRMVGTQKHYCGYVSLEYISAVTETQTPRIRPAIATVERRD
jgi:hypothetical protein